jgi:hypothetical protein
MKSGWGFWNLTRHGIGGDFERFGEDTEATIKRLLPLHPKGCDFEAISEYGTRFAASISGTKQQLEV